VARIKVKRGRKKGSFLKTVIFVVVIAVLLVGAFAVYNIYALNSSSELKLAKSTYTFSYGDKIYFLRVLNDRNKILIVRAEDGLTFKDKLFSISKDDLKDSTNSFLKEFELSSNLDFYIKVDENTVKKLNQSVKSQKEDIESFFEALKYRNSNIFDFFFVNSLEGLIRKYDRDSNFTKGAIANLLNAFAKYTIVSFDKLDLKADFSQPIQINYSSNSYLRKYADEQSFQIVKDILKSQE